MKVNLVTLSPKDIVTLHNVFGNKFPTYDSFTNKGQIIEYSFSDDVLLKQKIQEWIDLGKQFGILFSTSEIIDTSIKEEKDVEKQQEIQNKLNLVKEYIRCVTNSLEEQEQTKEYIHTINNWFIAFLDEVRNILNENWIYNKAVSFMIEDEEYYIYALDAESIILTKGEFVFNDVIKYGDQDIIESVDEIRINCIDEEFPESVEEYIRAMQAILEIENHKMIRYIETYRTYVTVKHAEIGFQIAKINSAIPDNTTFRYIDFDKDAKMTFTEIRTARVQSN